MPGTTSRESGPTSWRSSATSCGEQTMPSRPLSLASSARRFTCSPVGPFWPTASRSRSSRLVSTVTPSSFMRALRAVCFAASAAACIMARPPPQWTVRNVGSSEAAAFTAPETVLGMSCSLRSRNSGKPCATSRTARGPLAAKNSSPSLIPPTAPLSSRTRFLALAGSARSMAQRIGLAGLSLMAGSIYGIHASWRERIFQPLLCRRQIFQCMADRLEKRDLVVETPAGPGAAGQIEEIAGDVVRVEGARSDRLRQVAGFGQRLFAGVDEDAGAMQGFIVSLTQRRRCATDQVKMDAERQPVAVEYRRRFGRDATHDMRAVDGALEIVRCRNLERPPRQSMRQPRGRVGVAIPNQDVADWSHTGMRGEQMRREQPAADQQQPLAIGPRQVACRQGRGGGGAAGSQGRGIEDRQRLAGVRVHEHISTVAAGAAAAVCRVERRGDFDAKPIADPPCRADL